MSCLGFGVYLVNGDLSMYISAIYTNLVGNVPVLFILRRSPPPFVPRRACCPMAQAIGVEHWIAFTQLVAPHLRRSTRSQVSSNGRRRPRRASWLR